MGESRKKERKHYFFFLLSPKLSFLCFLHFFLFLFLPFHYHLFSLGLSLDHFLSISLCILYFIYCSGFALIYQMKKKEYLIFPFVTFLPSFFFSSFVSLFLFLFLSPSLSFLFVYLFISHSVFFLFVLLSPFFLSQSFKFFFLYSFLIFLVHDSHSFTKIKKKNSN